MDEEKDEVKPTKENPLRPEEVSFQRAMQTLKFKLKQQPFKKSISGTNTDTAIVGPVFMNELNGKPVEHNMEIVGHALSVSVPAYSMQDEDTIEEMGFATILQELQSKYMHKFSFKLYLPKWRAMRDINQEVFLYLWSDSVGASAIVFCDKGIPVRV